jgi:hypothetical protein
VVSDSLNAKVEGQADADPVITAIKTSNEAN